MSHTQELHVAISRDGGHTYQTLLRQEYNFSPPGTTFERETWAIPAEGVTHLRLVITPDKGGRTLSCYTDHARFAVGASGYRV